jgi:DNA-binding transcriptional regulator YbjK
LTTASTPKGERRRQALVAAAAELLAEGGFDAVRHRAVAERAGLPLASTTYYFDSLDDLVIAAAEQHGVNELGRGRARLEELTAAHRSVDALVELVLEMLLGPRYERLVATGRRPYLRPLMRKLSGELTELLREILQRSGADVDTKRAGQIIALVDGTVVNALIEIDPDPREAARAALRDAL